MAKANQKGSGSKKHGRNKDVCAKYRLQNRREKNKARKAKKLAKQIAKKRQKLAAKKAA